MKFDTYPKESLEAMLIVEIPRLRLAKAMSRPNLHRAFTAGEGIESAAAIQIMSDIKDDFSISV